MGALAAKKAIIKFDILGTKTPIGEDVKGPLGALLRTVSPATADALARYSRVPDLFHVEIDPAAILR